MRSSLPKFGFLAVLALLLTVTSGVQAQTPMELPPLPVHDASVAKAINDFGVVAGNSFGGGSAQRAVVWDRDGTPRELPPLSGDTQSVIDIGDNSINNHGAVVGTSSRIGRVTAVVWHKNGTLQALLPLPGDTQSRALAINAHGWVVGLSRNFPDLDKIVVWDQRGVPTALTSEGPAEGVSINPRGDVAASFAGAGVFTAHVLGRNGKSRNLFAGGEGEAAHSINARGQVAGASLGSLGGGGGVALHAVVWDSKGSPRALPPLDGDARSNALGINNKGEVVGVSVDITGIPETAVVWGRNGIPTALPPLPGDVGAVAQGINNKGEVVGVSSDSSGFFTAVVWR
jgi:uncharacterized membrane protein